MSSTYLKLGGGVHGVYYVLLSLFTNNLYPAMGRLCADCVLFPCKGNFIQMSVYKQMLVAVVNTVYYV